MELQSPEKIIEFFMNSGAVNVACSFVDNAGITRVKIVPIHKLAGAAVNGIGISNVFAVFGVNDHITTCPGFNSPSGDMRLIPDLSAAVALSGAPGWVWAPVWQYDQEKMIMPICQRHFAGRMADAAAEQGFTFQMTYEMEFTLLDEDDNPVGAGFPSYGIRKLLPVEDFLIALVKALEEQGITVSQIHPEYAAGQYEISVDPKPPVEAADQFVLLRQTICRIARQFGYRVSFAPVVIPEEVGNGCHIHFSAWSRNKNLFTGGIGPEELTPEGEAMAAGILDRLTEMAAVIAPSVLSFERLKPSNWAGAYTCWGWENREAALRLCKGTKTVRAKAANFELKSIDGTVNPYLVVGVLIACCLDGLKRNLKLPEPVQINPADLSESERSKRSIRPVAGDYPEAVNQLERSTFLQKVLGKPLYDSYLAVKQFDWECYKDKPIEEIVDDLRWRYG